MTQQQTRRKMRSIRMTVDADVDIDIDDIADYLIEGGWTPPADYSTDGETVDGTNILDADEMHQLRAVRDALLAHHDAEHGLTDWPTCRATPCASLPIIYRERAI